MTLKYWLAAYSWRRVSPRYVRQSLLVWGAGSTCFVTLAVLFWGVVRIDVAVDVYRELTDGLGGPSRCPPKALQDHGVGRRVYSSTDRKRTVCPSL